MTTPSSYAEVFEHAAGMRPHRWQAELGGDAALRSRVIRIPTGYGKTLGVVSAWFFHRVDRGDAAWPLRLVWALPMRVLVEQTAAVVNEYLAKWGRLWSPGADHNGTVGVHLLMGGADPGGEWNLHPEQPAVLIGTQDMLLSRALNRGFAAPRARWPMEFGLLSHDCLWVLDEVQLMDVGLATSAQLQTFFDDDAPRGSRPRASWWMSATLQPEWLKSVDTEARHAQWTADPLVLKAEERTSGLATIQKELAFAEVALTKSKELAARIAEEHRRLPEREFGRITLVVCNTVQRANETYDELKRLGVARELELVHGRFRPYERAAWKPRFLERATCKPGVDRIIVATQVVEAGVDISAGCVVTELAPWSSLVQRFGRCARYGGSGRVVVVDRGRDERAAAPYTPDELEGALRALETLASGASDVGIATLEEYESSLTPEQRTSLYPYEPTHLLTRRDFDELFDTTPDLTGADVDVSRFIRSGEERDVSVFWLDVPAPRAKEPVHPPPRHRPSREELCNVPFLAAREWLCGKESKSDRKPRLRAGVRAWIWDWIDGEWKLVERAALTPGKVVCVAADVGGYRADRGFDPDSKEPVAVVPTLEVADAQIADELEDSEELSGTPPEAFAPFRTIATHNREVGELARVIARAVGLDARRTELLVLAGRWHDLGKAHPAFQNTIGSSEQGARPERSDLAKAPDDAWSSPMRYPAAPNDERRGFRHELASCLALFAVLQRYEPTHAALLGPWGEVLGLLGEPSAPEPVADRASATAIEREILACTAEEFDLLAYLVLCHHGKVRVSLHAGPKDQEYRASDGRGLPLRGVREGDVLPAIPVNERESLPPLALSLAPSALGLSPVTGRSWRDRTLALQRALGPGQLAWLEALLIAADRRASRLISEDPLLRGETGGAG